MQSGAYRAALHLFSRSASDRYRRAAAHPLVRPRFAQRRTAAVVLRIVSRVMARHGASEHCVPIAG
jgi:hypothetical protein